MLAEYEVELLTEVTAVVTIMAESKETAVDFAFEQLVRAANKTDVMETVELMGYEVRDGLNKIH
tara:strand:+ start:1669 stop:1860 length:192 start_codon:yes stop_codon:yes gene_type:complete